MKKSWDLNNSTAQQTPNIKPGFVEESPQPPIVKHNLPFDKKPENKANQGQGTRNSNQVILFKLKNLLKKGQSLSQSSKLNLVSCTQILDPFGPPKKRVNFDICNKRQKLVFCDVSIWHTMVSSTNSACNWIVLSPTLLGHLDALVPSALKANKFSGPPALWSPQTCFGPPHMCAVCGDFEDWVWRLPQTLHLSI